MVAVRCCVISLLLLMFIVVGVYVWFFSLLSLFVTFLFITVTAFVIVGVTDIIISVNVDGR